MRLFTSELVKKYKSRTVVNHVTIDVKQGEIVGLLGPNGAGKTTTFYMTVGLIKPFSGHVYLDDEDITKFPMYKRAQLGIGYLAQEASVFRKMTVEDNIASVLELTGKPLDYQKDKLESLIAEFRLQKVRKNLGDRLSGGERRRTEIARCLAIDPKFIMLDEPFAGVDPIAVEDIQYIVWKLKDKNIGILLDFFSSSLDSCEFLFIIICREFNPTEKIIAGAVLFGEGVVGSGHFLLNCQQIGQRDFSPNVGNINFDHKDPSILSVLMNFLYMLPQNHHKRKSKT